MIETLLSLLGGAMGGLLRFVPEIFKIFTEQRDRDHEFRMTTLQLDIDKARAQQRSRSRLTDKERLSHTQLLRARPLLAVLITPSRR